MPQNFAAELISHRDAQLFESRQNVQFGNRQFIKAIDPSRMPCDHCIEPSATSWPSCRRSKFLAFLLNLGHHRLFKLSRKGAFSDPRSISLDHAHHLINQGWTKPRPRNRSADRGIGRGHKRISAMTDIQKGALRPLKKDLFTLLGLVIQETCGISDKGKNFFAIKFTVVENSLKRESRLFVSFGQ